MVRATKSVQTNNNLQTRQLQQGAKSIECSNSTRRTSVKLTGLICKFGPIDNTTILDIYLTKWFAADKTFVYFRDMHTSTDESMQNKILIFFILFSRTIFLNPLLFIMNIGKLSNTSETQLLVVSTAWQLQETLSDHSQTSLRWNHRKVFPSSISEARPVFLYYVTKVYTVAKVELRCYLVDSTTFPFYSDFTRH